VLTWGLASCLEPQLSLRVAVGGIASRRGRVGLNRVNYSRRVTVAAASMLTNYQVNDLP